MTNYRKAFFLAGIGNLVLLALLIASWWYSQVVHLKQQPAASASSAVEQPVQGGAPGLRGISFRNSARARPTFRRTTAIHRREVWGG